MSLTRRLQLALLLLLIVSVIVNALVQLRRTQEFLNRQLESHAQDTATSLSLALAPALLHNDLAQATSMVDAIFDRGYYRRIEWTATDGQIVLQRVSKQAPEQVPGWFGALLPITAPPGNSLLSSGWQQKGQLLVESHLGYAQLLLWQSARSLFFGSVLAMLVLFLVVIGLVQNSLAPLRRMADAARRFVDERAPIELPETIVVELQPLALALTQMSNQVAAQFKSLSEQVEQLNEQLRHDTTTPLLNRRALMAYLEEDEHFNDELVDDEHIHVFSMRITNFTEINLRHGFETGNHALQKWLREMAIVEPGQASWFRLSGTEFLCLSAVQYCADLHGQLQRFRQVIEHSEFIVSIGVFYRRRGEPMSQLLSRVDEILGEACLHEPPIFIMSGSADTSGSSIPSSGSQWRERLQLALQEARFRFATAQLETITERMLPARELLARLPLPGGEWISAGRLLGMAMRLRLDGELESALLDSLVMRPTENTRWQLNVGAAVLTQPDLLTKLAQLAGRQRISIETSERIALQIPELAAVIRQIRRYGLGFGLDQVQISAGLLPLLPLWRPDYLKLSSALSEGPDGQRLVRQIVQLAHALDIAIIVQDELGRRDYWAAIGVDGLILPPDETS